MFKSPLGHENYPNVLVIVTLREALAAHAVPDTAVTMELEWYRSEVDDIVRAYFATTGSTRPVPGCRPGCSETRCSSVCTARPRIPFA